MTDTPDRDEQKAAYLYHTALRCDENEAISAIASALREARQQERERCAGVADDLVALVQSVDVRHSDPREFGIDCLKDTADAIRSLESADDASG